MRLINTKTLEVKEFSGDRVPEYAILSHTWGKGEVTLQEMFVSSREVTTKAGYQKIQSACAQALADDHEWAWVDTCCIDKTSSAELSEAINSMYRWYSESAVCYAYLADFSTLRPTPYTLEQSRWFTRGWTLQELIAPKKVVFYDVNWTRIGSLEDAALLDQIQRASGVPAECLRRIQLPYEFSVARRMSWAAKRHCSREEDVAYCLMGLFDANMPLLYGEGKKAFTRLQEEILKDTDDHTILAWTVPPDDPRAFAPVGVLAESPADFALCGGMQSIYAETENPSTMTKLGLSITLSMEPVEYPSTSHLHQGCLLRRINTYSANLNCGLDPKNLVIIRLVLAETNQRSRRGPSRTYHRLGMTSLEYGRISSAPANIYIAKRIQPTSEDVPFGYGGFHLQNLPLAVSLGGGGGPVNPEPSAFMGYEVTSVHGPWVSSTTAERRLRLFRTYGCIQFLSADLGDYNEPIYIQFRNEKKSSSFILIVGYAENWVYLDVHQGTLVGPAPAGYTEKYLENRQSYRDRYGTIVQVQKDLAPRIWVTATLHREDPHSREGEAAGNRRHFIIFMDIKSSDLSLPRLTLKPKKDPAKDYSKVGLKSIGKALPFLRD